MTFNQYLKQVGMNTKIARIKARLKQMDVHEKTGLDYRHYQDLEAGKVNATLDTLYKLAKLFKVDVDELTKSK
jgi:transcriptional regulator with XRE-family HTH domain